SRVHINTLSLHDALPISYKAGSRLDWHIHPGGQILLITDGTGYYQEKGKPVQIVYKGDVIKCLPGVEHWHAAAPNSPFAYIAISDRKSTRLNSCHVSISY